MTFTESSSTVTLELPVHLYANLEAMAKLERVDLVELLNRLIQRAGVVRLPDQEALSASEEDPVFALIGAYRSRQPLIDDIAVSEDPDLYLALEASNSQAAGKHAWDIAPARYARGEDGRPIRIEPETEAHR